MTILTTERLILRNWKASDKPDFAALNADPEVMQYMPEKLSREKSDALVDKIVLHLKEKQFGLLAVEVVATGQFAGFVGLSTPRFSAPFTPCVEIGWRLSKEFWGKGYAPEAARACLSWGFEVHGLSEIVSFTVPQNFNSRRVMEKIGMVQDREGGFAHPLLPKSSPLSEHVLYRLKQKDFSCL